MGVPGDALPIGLNSMDLVVRVHGGAYTTGRNSTVLVVVPHGQDVIPRRSRGGASCKGLIPRRPRGDASLLGRNSTAWWWCLSYISG